MLPIFEVEKGAIQSVEPPESYFGLSYWSHMVPPYKPETVLMLGCGGHTIPKLINIIWGTDWEFTCNEKHDAKQFLSDRREDGHRFDYVIVDLFDGANMSDVVCDQEFIGKLRRVAEKLVAVNVPPHKINDVKDAYTKRNLFGLLAIRGTESNAILFFKRDDDYEAYMPTL